MKRKKRRKIKELTGKYSSNPSRSNSSTSHGIPNIPCPPFSQINEIIVSIGAQFYFTSEITRKNKKFQEIIRNNKKKTRKNKKKMNLQGHHIVFLQH